MFGIIVSLTKEPRSPQRYGEKRVPALCRHLRFFLLDANRDAKHGRRRALFTLAVRLTPFAAAPQSFHSRRPPPRDHKFARGDLACRRPLWPRDEPGPIEAAQ